MDHLKSKIGHSLIEGAQVIAELQKEENIDCILQAARLVIQCFRLGKKVLVAGNGGSLAEALHFAEELTGRYRRDRPALPAIALADPTHLTCVGNDYGFDAVFSRGVEAYGQKGDLFVGLTTSGNSPNILRAFATAQERGLKTLALLGRDGGSLKGVADCELIVGKGMTSDRIQEAHLLAIHTMIEIVEEELFYSGELEEGTHSGFGEHTLSVLEEKVEGAKKVPT